MNLTDLSDQRPNKAPIVVFDRNELGDKRLDPTETLAKLKEENRSLAAKSRLIDQEILRTRAWRWASRWPIKTSSGFSSG